MRIEHPRAADPGKNPPSRVDVGTRRHAVVDGDGFLEVDDDRAGRVMGMLADAYGVDYADDGTIVRDEQSNDGADADSLAYEEFAELGYQDRVDAVDAGDVDEHLSRILEEDGSENVREAVQKRREELEG